MYKSELLKLYSDQGLSASYLRYLLNVKYYEELKVLGYEKNVQFLTPIIVEKFFNIFGKPINYEENI